MPQIESLPATLDGKVIGMEGRAGFSGMTVNERLCTAGLMSAYEAALDGGDLKAINEALAQVGLRQDSDGMNWEFANDA